MPKTGMEPIRREALVKATIAEIGAAGSLDVTVSQIARRAGMSSALAHHYFGGKDQLIVATMHHLLTELRTGTLAALAGAGSPRERLTAVVRASFGPEQFEQQTVSAWLTFYHYAQSSQPAARLLRIYFARLNSNLAASLRQFLPGAEVAPAALAIAALIDGIYLRQGVSSHAVSRQRAIEMVEAHIDALLGRRAG